MKGGHLQEHSSSFMRKFNSRILKIFSWSCMVVPCLLLFHPIHENISWDAKPTPQQDASLLVNTRMTAEFGEASLPTGHSPGKGATCIPQKISTPPTSNHHHAKILHRLLPAGGLSTIPWSRAMQNAIGGDGKAIPAAAALDCCAGNGI